MSLEPVLFRQVFPQFFDLFEKAGGFRAGVAVLFHKFAQQFALFFVQVDRCFYLGLNNHIAALVGVENRHALVAQTELPSGLGAHGDFDFHAATINAGDFDVAPQGGCRHGDGHTAINGGAVTLIYGMRRQGYENI